MYCGQCYLCILGSCQGTGTSSRLIWQFFVQLCTFLPHGEQFHPVSLAFCVLGYLNSAETMLPFIKKNIFPLLRVFSTSSIFIDLLQPSLQAAIKTSWSRAANVEGYLWSLPSTTACWGSVVHYLPTPGDRYGGHHVARFWHVDWDSDRDHTAGFLIGVKPFSVSLLSTVIHV
jgi:hypothetical protein